MWIFTTNGFYSVVQHRDRFVDLLVRARSRADLVALHDLAARELTHRQAASIGPIEETLHNADYPYRLVVPKKVWKLLLAAMTDEVDYENFKTAVGKKNSVRAHTTYMNVWTALHKIEREADAGVYPPTPAQARLLSAAEAQAHVNAGLVKSKKA